MNRQRSRAGSAARAQHGQDAARRLWRDRSCELFSRVRKRSMASPN